jgi:hypothetical protein
MFWAARTEQRKDIYLKSGRALNRTGRAADEEW